MLSSSFCPLPTNTNTLGPSELTAGHHTDCHLKCVWIYVAGCELWVYFWHELNWASGLVAARPRPQIDCAELLLPSSSSRLLLVQKQQANVALITERIGSKKTFADQNVNLYNQAPCECSEVHMHRVVLIKQLLHWESKTTNHRPVQCHCA